jgi:hypothetical protein
MQKTGDVSEQPGVEVTHPEPGPEVSRGVESAHRFENVRLIKGSTGMGATGVLVAHGDSLEFQSKKGTLHMPNVRTVNYRGSAMDVVKVTVEYGGDGMPTQAAEFMDLSKGKMSRKAVKVASEELARKLNEVLNIKEMSSQDRVVLEETKRRRGMWQMVIGGLLALAGTIISLVTYSDASSDAEGGTYIVAYGPVIFGIILFIQGLVQSRKH